MVVYPLFLDTMRHAHHTTVEGNGKEYRENWTTGGLVASMLVVPVFLALLVAPGFVVGAALGGVALKLVERVAERRRAGASRTVRNSTTAIPA